MTDPAPLARIANASARRNLLSLLGPQLRAADHAQADRQAELCDSSTLLREDRQDLNNIGKETISDSAGVGAISFPNKQDIRQSNLIGSSQRGFENDELLRKQLLGSASKSRHTGSQHRTTNGKPDSRSLHTGTRNKDEEISSEEEQGRSGLGRSSKQHSANKLARPNKKTKIEVETFESMQVERLFPEEDDTRIKEETKSVLDPPARASAKPKSYLDQVLEAKRNKQQKKMEKKQKRRSDINQGPSA